MNPAIDYGTTAVAASSFATLIVQWVKLMWIDPNMLDTPRRTGLINGLTFVINFGLLILLLTVQGMLDWSNLAAYLGTATAQFGGSMAAYRTLKLGGNPKTLTPTQPTVPSAQAGGGASNQP